MPKTTSILMGAFAIAALSGCANNSSHVKSVRSILFGADVNLSCAQIYNRALKNGESEESATAEYNGCKVARS